MGAASDILLGVDFGTGGCKVSAVNPSDGSLVADASLEYPTEHAHIGWSEQNPSDWYPAMCGALKILSSKGVDLRNVRALAFDGSTHNAVLLDENMRPLRKTIMWTDQRSVSECEFLRRSYADKIFATTYQMPSPTWTLPQMMWLKNNESGILKKLKHILFVKDYVRYLVSGVAATDYIEAQGTMFFDMEKMAWSGELAALADIPESALPWLAKPCDVLGCVLPEVSADTGIAAGTPVICGSSDSAVEDYGAGAIEEGDCIIKLATAGNVNVMTSRPHPYGAALTYSHVIDGLWYSVSATNAAALCQRWFRDLFFKEETLRAKAEGLKVFDMMDSLAEESPAGSNGIMFHPYLQGERSPYWDPNLRASFIGMSISSTRGDFVRAILEGVAFSLRDCREVLDKMGLGMKRIFLIGGGARSKLWGAIVANVFGLEVGVPTPGDASYGSALLAGVGAGFFKNPREAVVKCLKSERSILPNPLEVGLYAELFEKYKSVHGALAPIYGKSIKST